MNSVLHRRLILLISLICFTTLVLMFGGLFVAHADALTVTSTNDSGDGSLRQAIAAADSSDTIIFDESLSGLTVALTNGQLELTKSLTIDGSGLAEMVKISGSDSSRVFHVTGDVTVTLSHLAIISGSVNGSLVGGAIANEGTLYLLDSAVYGNSSNTLGGGIANAPGKTMVIQDSTIMNNNALSGGGINNNGSLTITGSTIINNNALVVGGGIVNWEGSLSLNNSTLGDNSALAGGGLWAFDGSLYINNGTFNLNNAPFGGGAYFQAGTLDMRNTILANNPDGSDCFIDDEVQINGNSHNLVEDGSCSNDASDLVSGDPKLDSLVDNGVATLTYQPLFGSPAIDAGDNATCEPKDQHGQTRPIDGDINGAADCDIGSVEVLPNADITINKGPDFQEVELGSTAAFTITVKNTGYFTLTNVTISDPLSPGCDDVLTILNPANEKTISCELIVTTPSFTNEVSVTGDVFGSEYQVTDSDTAEVSVVHSGGITIQKSPADQLIDYRGSAFFTVTVKNSGELALVNVTVIDLLSPACNAIYPSLAPGAVETKICSEDTILRSFTNWVTVTAALYEFPAVEVTDIDETIVRVKGYFIHLPIIPKDYVFINP
jgi:uncharacterized repeat protein (TIGR01451 family)